MRSRGGTLHERSERAETGGPRKTTREGEMSFSWILVARSYGYDCNWDYVMRHSLIPS